jgi:DNA (cytosine-5)-methyltransferase 1
MHTNDHEYGQPLTVGSLFSGYGGLDLAVERTFNARTIWFCEINEPVARVFSHHWPRVPNLGDITKITWADVPPVDILIGGFPCQDVSVMGHRAGIAPGTRSGLWSHMAAAIDVLRPSFVVIENVRGLLTAPAVTPTLQGANDDRTQQRTPTAPPTTHGGSATSGAHPAVGDMEPDPWGMGDRTTRSLVAAAAGMSTLGLC